MYEFYKRVAIFYFIVGFIAGVITSGTITMIRGLFKHEKAEVPIISPLAEPTPTPVPTIITPAPHRGKASYYSRAGCLGCSPTMTMANGEPLDDTKLTVAYNDAPINSWVVIRNNRTGEKVRARVTDTGGFKRHGKIIDLTIATRDAIGCGPVCDVEVYHDYN